MFLIYLCFLFLISEQNIFTGIIKTLHNTINSWLINQLFFKKIDCDFSTIIVDIDTIKYNIL